MSETFVARLTPSGRGAVAIVQVTGPAATNCVARCFQAASRKPLTEIPINQIAVGRWGSADGEELVVCRRSETEVEVHSHGGDAAIRAVIEALVAHGCLECSRVSSRCRVSPKLGSESRRDSPAWEAHDALASATTLRTAAILLDQLNGALSTAIHNALTALDAADLPRATTVLDDLLRHRDLGLHLTAPWRVVLAGAPNVGKSSLINALAGFERAIVSPIAGTTRDVVTVSTAIDGWPVTLADTAGLRSATDELEAAGVELAGAALATADLAVLVEDASCPVCETYSPSRLPARVLQVCNKIDLVSLSLRERVGVRENDQHAVPPHPALSQRERVIVNTSAVTGTGIAELVAAIGNLLVPNPPPRGAAILFTAAHVDALVTARQAVARKDVLQASAVLRALLSCETV